MKAWMKRVTALALAAGMTVSLAACGAKAENLMDGIKPGPVAEQPLEDADRAAVADFGLRLLNQTAEAGENTLISPLSVMTALAMTANGAEGETLEQLEAVLGMDRQRLNSVLHTYLNTVEGESFHSANSIWFADREDFSVNQDFLQTNADHYGAQLYKAPLDDGTVGEINGWVKKNTDGMIPKILEQLSPEAVMCLVNALAFEGEWTDPYEDFQVQERPFHKDNGEDSRVDFFHSEEYRLLEGENCMGFMKPYKGERYAFAALLPDEQTTVARLAESLDGTALQHILANGKQEDVIAAIPRLKTEFSTELNRALTELGMPLAFTEEADFSSLGRSEAGPICISRVIHKTFLELGEKGTRAGAATVVEMEATSCAPEEEPREVILDRPFLYMLVDTRENIPFFLGVMNDPAA